MVTGLTKLVTLQTQPVNVQTALLNFRALLRMKLAGAVGFEPTIHDTKNRCLTTWLRPNKDHSSNIPI